jgi:sec-independent protein translocase protein TatA
MSFASFAINGPTLVVLCLLGLILFGRRLPEMGRSIGKSLKEFQKGMSGIEEEVVEPGPEPARPQLAPPARVSSAVPRFTDDQAVAQPPAVV